MKKTTILVLAALVVSLPFGGVAEAKEKKKKKDVEAIGDRDVGSGINFYSLEKEIALGKSLAEEVERTSRIVNDPLIAEYVNRIGQNLARNSDSKIPFYFKVIDSEQVNAFALPGGYLFVNTGLLLKAETEGEVAGVLAHEIAHVAARHGTRQASRGQIANMATIPLIILSGGSWTGYGIAQAAGMVIPIGFLQFSRGFEREADFLGLQYLYASGYDPVAFIDFFERLQSLEKRKPGTLAKVFSSHPMTDDRIEAAQKEIQEILPSKPEYVVSTSEFLAVKDRLMAQLIEGKEETAANRPRIKRGAEVDTSTIERPSDAPASSEDEDDRPVLRRGGSQGADTAESAPPTAEGDDDRPILRRDTSEPSETSTIEAPPKWEDDEDRPVLKRKN